MTLISTKCKNKALELLGLREYFSDELFFKLKNKYDFSEEHIKKALDFAKKYNYLNDERALNEFTDEIKRKKKGFLYLKKKIIEKHSSSLLKKFNLEFFYSEEEEFQVAKNFVLYMNLKDLEIIKKKLKNRGFRFQTIKRIENDFKK